MEAVVFCGLQGSGKSSLFKERFFDTHVRVSLDLLRTRERELMLLHVCLATRQPFVVDNTNPTREQRLRYARLGRASGFRCSLYWVDSTVEDALSRNALRTGDARVPDVAIRGTAAKFEAPTSDEAWDALFRVRIGAEALVVEEIRS